MDDLVVRAMVKWPHVPHCYGWLALDARGEWYMRDDRVQAAGPFPQVKGSRITHDKLKAFIERNYLADVCGNWYFQNGPQRVYVELEASPWVWRLQRLETDGLTIHSHTGQAARHLQAWLDESGRLFLTTDLGFGIVHTADMALAGDAVESQLWSPREGRFEDFGAMFGYRLRPEPEMAGRPG